MISWKEQKTAQSQQEEQGSVSKVPRRAKILLQECWVIALSQKEGMQENCWYLPKGSAVPWCSFPGQGAGVQQQQSKIGGKAWL